MGLGSSLKKAMKDPKNQDRLKKIGKQAEAKAKDPKTRAQLNDALGKAKKKRKKK